MPSEHRLHPLSFLFAIGSSLRAFLFPLILALLAVRSGGYEMFFAVFFVPYAFYSLIRYFTYRYALAEEDLVIRTGFIFRNERHIPYARIHNVGSVQNIFHRIFGVVEVVLETAGGQEPEARLQVLSVRAMDDMKRHILSKKRETGRTLPGTAGGEAPPQGGEAGALDAVEAARTLLRLPVRELVLLGIVENRGMIVVGAAMGVAWELGWVGSGRGGFFSGVLRRGVSTAESLTGALFEAGLLAVAALIVFLVLVRLFSIAWAIIKEWDFHLQISGRDLTTTSGLFTRITATTPLHRIQVLSIRQKPLQRLFGRAEVRVEIAGGGEESEKRTTRPKRLAPLITWKALPALLAECQPGINLDAVAWQPVDPRCRRRILRRSLIIVGILTVVAMALFARWGPFPYNLWPIIIPAVLIPVSFVNARKQAINYGYALEDGVVAVRNGWIWKRWSLARCSKIQVVTMAQSPFDRRYGMHDLHPDTAGAGPVGGSLTIPYLRSEVARDLSDQLSREVAHTALRW